MTTANYSDAFGAQWNAYRTTQLDSHTSRTVSTDRLRRCLGPELVARMQDTEPVTVLEVGCGAGRFTEVLLSWPAPVIMSVDMSSAVEANAANFPPSARHAIVKADINDAPLPRESFDVVLCLGVIQHTPSPEETIRNLYSYVKPGGWLVLDHYAPSITYYTKLSLLLLRPILKRLSPERGMRACERLTRLFFPLHRAARHSRLAQVVLSRVSPLLTYFHTYPELNDQLQYEWALLDTHDALTDYYKHFRTLPQIRDLLWRLGADPIEGTQNAPGSNGVEARGRKPVTAR